MQIGAVFPQTEIGTDPAAIRAWAQAIEGLGYRHILAYDHVLGAGLDTRPDWRGPYHAGIPFHEVFVLFGYLAALTESVELATGVLILPQRQTALVAKQAAEVDVLSGGRMRLGIGVGWNAVEYDALGEPFGNRGTRCEEQIEVLRALWASPTTSYAGHWHQIDNAGINPLPVRRRIPIWLGGQAEATLRRAGQMGDGWLPQRPPDGTARAMLDRLWQHTADAGRDRADVGIEARLSTGLVPPDGWVAYAAGWRELGATHLGVNTMGANLADVDEHIAVLGRVIAEIG
ncbi:MAG TPA: LLM class F420-dependent oxidoreductase [Mycobacteriales bacterium]|nr:LLM class F420-dependent oxidoreductase [Mycobacteriales bacterium]